MADTKTIIEQAYSALLSTVERASRTPPREFYEWVADHILSVTGSLPGSRHLIRKSSTDEMRVCRTSTRTMSPN
jgi:hypothetical protein